MSAINNPACRARENNAVHRESDDYDDVDIIVAETAAPGLSSRRQVRDTVPMTVEDLSCNHFESR